MNKLSGLLFIPVCLFVIVSGCGGRKAPPHIATIGSDTLTAGTIAALRPDAPGADIILLQAVLARRGAAAQSDSLARGFAEQLTLRTAVEWNTPAAVSLLAAGNAIQDILGSSQTPAGVKTAIDSLVKKSLVFSKTEAANRGGRIPAAQIPAALEKTPGYRDSLAAFAATLLMLDPKTAHMLAEFCTYSSQTAGAKKDMSRLVRNLVADRNAPQSGPGKEPTMSEPGKPDNSEQVLKVRTQGSISDTIKSHSDEIKALYRKYLKTDSEMSGTVHVELRVNPAGAVISTRISGTTIANKQFLQAFAAFIQTIAFKPVPEKLGNMTFIYPFEFSPEE